MLRYYRIRINTIDISTKKAIFIWQWRNVVLKKKPGSVMQRIHVQSRTYQRWSKLDRGSTQLYICKMVKKPN